MILPCDQRSDGLEFDTIELVSPDYPGEIMIRNFVPAAEIDSRPMIIAGAIQMCFEIRSSA
jgi:hypothetical protein